MKTANPQINQLLSQYNQSTKIVSQEQVDINNILGQLALLEQQLGPLNQLNSETLTSITELKKSIHSLFHQIAGHSLDADLIRSSLSQLNNLQIQLKSILGQNTDLSTLDGTSDLINQINQENLSLQHILLKQAEQLKDAASQAKLITDIAQQIKKALTP